MKTSKMVKVAHTESRDAGTDPMIDLSSFDPYARGVSTSGDYYSAANGMTTRKTDYYTANSSAAFRLSAQTCRDFVPRPVAISTQRKLTTKRNLEQDQGEAEEVPTVTDDAQTPREPANDKRLQRPYQRSCRRAWSCY